MYNKLRCADIEINGISLVLSDRSNSCESDRSVEMRRVYAMAEVLLK